MEDDLLLTSEVSKLVRRPDATLRYWRHIGAGPKSFRLQGRIVYRRSEVSRWIASCEAAEQTHGDAA